VKNVNEALELPFNEYMLWCHEWCRAKAEDDPIFADVFQSTAYAMLEAIWARRYWFHKCGVQA
jgi:hypothetical protein